MIGVRRYSLHPLLALGTVTLSALKIFEGFDGSASDTASAINITTHNSTSTRREAD